MLLGGLLLIASCESDIDDNQPTNTNNPNNPGDPASLAPDELSSFLVFRDNPTKIDGELPAAPDGQLKIDVKDTIFVVKGYPLGNRINFLKDPSQNVTGFYIYVEGASHHFDVPETIEEDQYVPTGGSDTASVVVLDFDPTSRDEDVSYPFTTEITIQPHDEGGTPLDEFEKWITVEDPESSCNSILLDEYGGNAWLWDFTIRINNDEIVNVWAPGISPDFGAEEVTGCCRGGNSDYGPLPGDCGSATPDEMVIFYAPDQFYLRPFEMMLFLTSGDLQYYSGEIYLRADPYKTDFCNGDEPFYYYHKNEHISETGQHDFVPGAGTLSIDFDTSVPNRPPRKSNIIYTCHSLILDFGSPGDEFASVYHALDDNNPFTYYVE